MRTKTRAIFLTKAKCQQKRSLVVVKDCYSRVHSRGKQANGRREPDGPPSKKEEQILMQVAVSDTKD